MDSSTAHTHHQQETLEMVVSRSKVEKKGRDMQGLKCPRCDSTNTKFCYYNNYSLSQPRYICKSCRRYWTKGGTLRNVPVGGGCRKNKRSSSAAAAAKHHPIPTPIPPLSYASNDLTLAIARLQKQTSALDDRDFSIWTTPTTMPRHHAGDVLGGGAYVSPSSSSGLIDALRSGFNLETPSHNLFYGLGNGNLEMGGGIHDFSGGATASATPAAAPATVKHEMCSDREGESRVFWGLPWQSIGDGATADFDSGRSANWNGIGASSWQGLLNSPLM